MLGVPEPAHAHVPLVLGPDGARLAKRHGDVTLREVPAAAARAWMLRSLGLPEDLSPADFDPAVLPREPTHWHHRRLRGSDPLALPTRRTP